MKRLIAIFSILDKCQRCRLRGDSYIPMKILRLIFALSLFCSAAGATTYYILPGGTGTFAGTSWTNANCKIPDPLSAGDIVYIGYTSGNSADTDRNMVV